jgi:hypothetical protein
MHGYDAADAPLSPNAHGPTPTHDSPTGVLPPDTELPPSTGPYAVWNPRELAYPQETPPTPTDIGGP